MYNIRGKLVIFAVMFMFLFTCVQFTYAADSQMTTKSKLAEILVDILGIEMPEGIAGVSDAELFEIQANLLSERGMTLFFDAAPDEGVTRGELAEILYRSLPESPEATIGEKIAYLSDLEYLQGGSPADFLTLDETILALNIPTLYAAVAEAYTPPGFGGGIAERNAAPNQENPDPEDPASRV